MRNLKEILEHPTVNFFGLTLVLVFLVLAAIYIAAGVFGPQRTITTEIQEPVFDIEGSQFTPEEVEVIDQGVLQGEVFSFSGSISDIAQNYFIINAQDNKRVKISVNENTSYYKVFEDGTPQYQLAFSDLSLGDSVDVNYLREQGSAVFYAYAVIVK